MAGDDDGRRSTSSTSIPAFPCAVEIAAAEARPWPRRPARPDRHRRPSLRGRAGQQLRHALGRGDDEEAARKARRKGAGDRERLVPDQAVRWHLFDRSGSRRPGSARIRTACRPDRRPAAPADRRASGRPRTIETYTVVHRREGPRVGHRHRPRRETVIALSPTRPTMRPRCGPGGGGIGRPPGRVEPIRTACATSSCRTDADDPPLHDPPRQAPRHLGRTRRSRSGAGRSGPGAGARRGRGADGAARRRAAGPRAVVAAAPLPRDRPAFRRRDRRGGRGRAARRRDPQSRRRLAEDERGPWLRNAFQIDWREVEGDIDYDAWRAAVGEALGELDGNTAVFSHFVAINAALSCVTGEPRVLTFRPDHASITVFEVDDGPAQAGRARARSPDAGALDDRCRQPTS